MCGGDAPEDKSDEVARIEAEAAREQRAYEARQAEIARQRQEQEEARELREFQQRLDNAFNTGISGAESYFTQRGVGLEDYQDDILREARERRLSVPELSTDVGSYFGDLGADVYQELTDALRGRSSRAIREIAPEGFERSRIADTADDPILQAILAEQRGEAEGYAQRLMDRGVITASGLESALADIEDQANRGRFTLDEFGNNILAGGRGDALNLVNQARSRASSLELGEDYDPYASLGGDLESFFTGFMSDLGNRLRATAPTDLFDVSGLPVIAGATQGAGNTAFDPRAIAGIIDEEEEEDEEEDDNGVGVF